MRILFYAPFKPLGHPNPSGDLVIATGLHGFLSMRGHQVFIPSRLRTRWIFRRPLQWPLVMRELAKVYRLAAAVRPHLWLTYHTYYKAPDIIGPLICRRLGIPYVIFQGIYSTKRRKAWRTWPGFMLNRLALQAADHILSNRQEDWINLKRLVPADRLTYLRPGIYPDGFDHDRQAREQLRNLWQVGDAAVVLTAAMFRPGVKQEGLAIVIRACGRLWRGGVNLHLVIAGDGAARSELEQLAFEALPTGQVHFLGKVARGKMYQVYSAADVFAFPGIRESLGMVFLEAQACGLPVVAFNNGGIPEVVADGKTGLLVPLYNLQRFDTAIRRLLEDPKENRRMGMAAAHFVRQRHDLNKNYPYLELKLLEIVSSCNTTKTC